jgi:hypothetical protein
MSPEEIANHTARVIEAMRAEAEKHKGGNQFVYRMLTESSVVAAAVAAYLHPDNVES